MARSRKEIAEIAARVRNMTPKEKAAEIVKGFASEAKVSMKKCIEAGLKTLSKRERERLDCFCMIGGTFCYMIKEVNGVFEPVLSFGAQEKAPLQQVMEETDAMKKAEEGAKPAAKKSRRRA